MCPKHTMLFISNTMYFTYIHKLVNYYAFNENSISKQANFLPERVFVISESRFNTPFYLQIIAKSLRKTNLGVTNKILLKVINFYLFTIKDFRSKRF